MKFKEGDRVVITSDIYSETIGNIGVITDVDYDKGEDSLPYSIVFNNGDSSWIGDDEAELEHVFNSPLYKALA